MLLKFWLSCGDHCWPCSWQRAASMMSGSQKSGHSHCASHSFRQDWHWGVRLSSWTLWASLQDDAQKSGCLRQVFLQLSLTLSEMDSSGQKSARQLAADPALWSTLSSRTVLPPQGITKALCMDLTKFKPFCSSSVNVLSGSLAHSPTGGSSSVLLNFSGHSHSGGVDCLLRSKGSHRPTQIGVSMVARSHECLPEGQEPESHLLVVRFHVPFGTAISSLSYPIGKVLLGAFSGMQSGVLRSGMSRSIAGMVSPSIGQ
mmetsp:Transcript_148252/g.412900  ORF Transcript_148252/g.412900 Transcript_148252/m.412900 type:complete len:258 (-) Transcript_148252:1940-2713(-)